MDDVKVSDVKRKLIVLYDGEYNFLVDIVCTGKEKYIRKGIDSKKGIETDWIPYEGINPDFDFAEYLKTLIK